MKDEGKKFSDDGWVDHIWKGSSKNAISSLQNSSDDLLFFVLSKDAMEEK